MCSCLYIPELFMLTKIRIKHGKDHLQCCIKTALTCSSKATPQIYIYTVSKTVFICSARNASKKERRGGQRLQTTRHWECLQNC